MGHRNGSRPPLRWWVCLLARLLDGLHEAAGAADDAETLAGENLLGLHLGVRGPGSNGIEADVFEPVTKGAPAMALPLLREREVVMRVGVLRYEVDGAFVSGDRLGQALELVEHIA